MPSPDSIAANADSVAGRTSDAVLERVRLRFSFLKAQTAELMAFLCSKLPTSSVLPDDVLELAVEDLALALACAGGDVDALRFFDAEYLSEVSGMVGHMRLSASQVDEVRQRLRVDLLVPQGDGRVRLLDFGGRGSLCAWLRVSAVRVALKVLRGRSKASSLDDDNRLLEKCAGDDAELAFLKRDEQLAFRDVLTEAMTSLDPRDVNRLRLHYLDGLSLEELAALERVHRATVARWLGRAREALLANVQRILTSKMRFSESECSSFMRLAQSRFDVSLRLVGTPPKV